MELRTLVSRTLWWSALLISGGLVAACGPDEPLVESTYCVLEPKTDRLATVRCGEAFFVDIWRMKASDVGCYLASGDNSENAVIRCGEFTVKLNDGCPDGFDGNVAFGDVPANVSPLSATAFSLSQCRAIHGNLSVDGYAGEALAPTLSVSPSPISIQRVSAATVPRLAGALRRLETVSGDLLLSRIGDSERLEFSSLTSVGGEVRVDALVSVQALGIPLLRVIGRGLWLDRNPALQSLDISSLERVGGPFRASENEALVWLDAPKLHSIASSVRVRQNDVLTELSLPVLAVIPSYLRVHENPRLESVNFTALEEVAEMVQFSDMHKLEVVSLRRLTAAGSLDIQGLEALHELALPYLKRVDEECTLSELPSLETMDMTALEQLNGTLFLTGTVATTTLTFPALAILGGLHIHHVAGLEVVELPSLEEITGAFELRGNAGILSVAQGGDTTFGVAGDVIIVDNEELLDVCFERIHHIGGALTITNNPSLQHISLAAETIEGPISITKNNVHTVSLQAAVSLMSVELNENPLLTTLICPHLQEVHGDLTIRGNAILSGGDLPKLWRVGHFLEIRHNPMLPGSVATQICVSLTESYGCNINNNGR